MIKVFRANPNLSNNHKDVKQKQENIANDSQKVKNNDIPTPGKATNSTEKSAENLQARPVHPRNVADVEKEHSLALKNNSESKNKAEIKEEPKSTGGDEWEKPMPKITKKTKK